MQSKYVYREMLDSMYAYLPCTKDWKSLVDRKIT